MRFNPHPTEVEGGYFLQCIDPGGDTGMALLYIRPDDFDFVDHRTIAYDPHRSGEMPTEAMVEWTLEYVGRHHLLYEDFHVRNTKAQKDTTALKVIGSIDKMIFDQKKCGNKLYEAVHAQEPVEAKSMVSDDDLIALDLMLDGHEKRHVRDALRHGVTFLTRRRYRPVCQIAYPKGGGAAKDLKNPRPGSRRSADSIRAR